MLTKTRLLLCGGALSGMIWAGTFALFTDSGTATSTFTAGTVNLVVGGDTGDAYAFTSIQMSNMKPGDVMYAPLTIDNVGTLGFNYTMATSATNADTPTPLGLAAQLTLGIRKVASTCDSTTYAAASGDTMMASGALSTGAITSRLLLAATGEVACFRVELPSASNDTFQGATTIATFTFSASQS